MLLDAVLTAQLGSTEVDGGPYKLRALFCPMSPSAFSSMGSGVVEDVRVGPDFARRDNAAHRREASVALDKSHEMC